MTSSDAKADIDWTQPAGRLIAAARNNDGTSTTQQLAELSSCFHGMKRERDAALNEAARLRERLAEVERERGEYLAALHMVGYGVTRTGGGETIAVCRLCGLLNGKHRDGCALNDARHAAGEGGGADA